MLTEISIENFKAFAKKQCIPLKPITLLCGPNSAGKSSLLQALLMLKQTSERGGNEGDALLSKGRYVDLGGYQEFINNHKRKNEFKLGLSFNFHAYYEYLSTKILKHGPSSIDDPLSIEFTFFQENNGEVLLKAIRISQKLFSEPIVEYKNVWFIPELRRAIKGKVELEKQKGKDLSEWMSNLKKSVLVLESMNFKNKILTQQIDESFGLNYDEYSLQEDIEQIREELESINNEIESYQNKVDGEETRKQLKQQEDKLVKVFEFLKVLYDSCKNRSYNKLLKIKTPPFNRLVSLSNCFPKEILRGDELLFKSIDEFSNFSLSNFRTLDPFVYVYTDFIETGLVVFMSQLLSFYLQHLIYVGPLRALPQRCYGFSGGFLSDVGISGENTADILFKRQDVVEKVNEWFRQVGIDYEIEVTRMKHDIFEITMKENKTGVKATTKDVGFGVSQLLPIIVQGIVSKNDIIFIEQPEIHIHPRLQAELGSFIARNIKIRSDELDGYVEQEPGNQFIIETHSEHLILRLLRLIRKTTNGELEEGEKPLHPEDVAVIYAKPTDHGTELMELRISDDGDFIDKWPEGFFTERAKELI